MEGGNGYKQHKGIEKRNFNQGLLENINGRFSIIDSKIINFKDTNKSNKKPFDKHYYKTILIETIKSIEEKINDIKLLFEEVEIVSNNEEDIAPLD